VVGSGRGAHSATAPASPEGLPHDAALMRRGMQANRRDRNAT
jgi:hypothetical protein